MKKKFRSRIVAALVAVTALTCCFVGSTFAKYTSSTDKKATAQIAHWEVNGITDAVANNTFTMKTGEEKFSPALEKTGEKYINTVTTQDFKITNNSDVKAIITLTIKDEKFYNGESEVTNMDGKDVAGTFSATLALAAGQDGLELNDAGNGVYTIELDAKAADATTGPSVNLQLTITWTTVSDTVDTWIGMNLTSVGYTVNAVATQSSELPTA